MQQNENDWNWLAGIFEGEGTACFRNSEQHRYRSLYVAVYQNETSMLKEVRRIAQTGNIHPHDPRGGCMWCCSCASAREFLTKLLPYIRSDHKKMQVTQALELDAELRAQGRKIILKTLADGRDKRWGKAA